MTTVTEQKSFYLDLQKAIEIADQETLPNPESVLLKYIEQYYDGGKITPINIHKSAVQASEMKKYVEYNYKNRDIHCTSDDENLIAVGVLKCDVNYEDNDPYETAGGYIKGIAKAGTKFELRIKYDYTGFKLEILADVNIILDHYNNNYFGISTGNGSKEYEQGERVEKKIIKKVRSFNDLWSIELGGNILNIKKIDIQKFEDFIYNQGRRY